LKEAMNSSSKTLHVWVVKVDFGLVWFMVLNATFNNISVISWWSVLLVEYPRKQPTCRKSLTTSYRHWMRTPVCHACFGAWRYLDVTWYLVLRCYQNGDIHLTRIILRPLSALSLDEVNYFFFKLRLFYIIIISLKINLF
jgi:hypothetical protein